MGPPGSVIGAGCEFVAHDLANLFCYRILVIIQQQTACSGRPSDVIISLAAALEKEMASLEVAVVSLTASLEEVVEASILSLHYHLPFSGIRRVAQAFGNLLFTFTHY